MMYGLPLSDQVCPPTFPPVIVVDADAADWSPSNAPTTTIRPAKSPLDDLVWRGICVAGRIRESAAERHS
jgi:hypothetical protein